MQVKVLYFGILKDQFGAVEEQIELPGGSSAGELLEFLRGRTSNLLMSQEASRADQQLWRSLALAVNREYAQPTTVLHEGDEVALLPPVSGGSCPRSSAC